MANMVAHTAGHANPAGLREPFKAGRDVDTVAENIPILYHDVAHVYSDTELHSPLFGQSVVRLGERVLNLDSRMYRVENTGKFCKYTVPSGAGDPTTVAQNRLVDDTAVSGQRRKRLLLIGLHQPTVARHVCGKNRGQLAFQRWRFHQPETFRQR